jgi:hypothetical protein
MELRINDTISPELYAQLKIFLNSNLSLFNNSKLHLHKSSDETYFIYQLDKNDLNSIKNIKIYGIFVSTLNGYRDLEDYLYMEVGVKLQSSGIPLEIKTINSGKQKRCGRGSQAIKFLEDFLIPELNQILHYHNYSDKIQYIYGISAELSPETNALARAKFYNKNGFIISHSHFYKYL